VLRQCWLGSRKSIQPVKNGGRWRLALLSPDGEPPIQMVSMSTSVNLPLNDKSRSSLLAPAQPGGPRKRAVKRLWCVVMQQVLQCNENHLSQKSESQLQRRQCVCQFYWNDTEWQQVVRLRPQSRA